MNHIVPTLRALLRLAVVLAGFLVMTLGSVPAFAGTITLFAPLTGDFSKIGNEFKSGAELAMKSLGNSHDLQILDDACSAETAQTAFESLKDELPDLITGFLCNDAALSVATAVAPEQIPVLVSGARTVRMIKDRERENWNLWRFAPGDDYPAITAAKVIADQWQTKPFAIVDDGTIYGRSFTDKLRLQLGELDLKPQFSDTFRAAQSTQAGLVRRLQRSGVTAVFIASATTEDLMTVARDISRLDAKIDLITTEAMMVLPFLEDAKSITTDLKIMGWPEPQKPDLSALMKTNGIEPSLAAFQGYATIEIALKALAEAPASTTQNLQSNNFETVLGSFSFNDDGSSTFNPYTVLEWNRETLTLEPVKSETQ